MIIRLSMMGVIILMSVISATGASKGVRQVVAATGASEVVRQAIAVKDFSAIVNSIRGVGDEKIVWLLQEVSALAHKLLVNAAAENELEIVKHLIEDSGTIDRAIDAFWERYEHDPVGKEMWYKGPASVFGAVSEASWHEDLATFKYLVDYATSRLDDKLDVDRILDDVSYSAEQTNAVRYLVEEKSANPNEGLGSAAYGGEIQLMDYLIERGADWFEGTFGAVQSAALNEKNPPAVIYYLLGVLGSDLSPKDASHVVEWGAKTGHLAIVKRMVDHGAKKIAYQKDAARYGHIEVAKYLLELQPSGKEKFNDALAGALNWEKNKGVGDRKQIADFIEWLIAEGATDLDRALSWVKRYGFEEHARRMLDNNYLKQDKQDMSVVLQQ